MNKIIFFKQIWSGTVFLFLFTLLFGLLYPGLVTLINQFAFPDKSFGSLMQINHQVKGSSLIGQQFNQPHYFLSRPSATPDMPYNGVASSGSNLSTANPILKSTIQTRINLLQSIDPDNQAIIPIDLLTASGSGLDPHISIASAEYQIARIARLRHLNPIKLRYLVYSLTELRQYGILGEPRVNVLKLNSKLDEVTANPHGN